MYTINDLFDLNHTLAADYLRAFKYPWEALKGIKDFILALGPTLGEDYEEVSERRRYFKRLFSARGACASGI